ncbi:MAG: dihydroneopterin aldolase [Pedosphaera sp.]|nr:dihydroneopterin aldolase [Pedosphaera sp.]
MGEITIKDLEVFYCVGVTQEERAQPQRLLITVEMERDLTVAMRDDDLAGTIDYFAVSERLLAFGKGRQWKLIEALAGDIAKVVLSVYHPTRVLVEVKKFVIPQAQYVSVRISRERLKP